MPEPERRASAIPRWTVSPFRTLLGGVPLAVCLWLPSACSAPHAKSPQAAIEAYATAVDEGRLEDAYALLSSETRQNLGYPEFERLVEENPKEVKALVDALSRPTEGARVTATFEGKSGQTVEMVYEDGQWRIQESAVNLWAQDSPQTALQSFLRAYDARRYDVLVHFIPEDQKEGVSSELLQRAWEGEQKLELEQITEGLRASLPTAEIEVVGDRATMSYGAGGTVELVREQGVWKIEDFQ